MAETAWAEMMRAALTLGLEPCAFWRLSLREWRMLTEMVAGPSPLGRGELERLMATWPDGSDG